MKIPFDIEKAKAGTQVVTKEGKKVRILTFDRRITHANQDPIVGLINDGLSESVATFNNKGKNGLSYNDLFLEVESEYKPFDFSNIPVGRVIKSRSGSKKTVISAADTMRVFYFDPDVNDFKGWLYYKSLLESYVFEDGSPCGVLVS